MDAIEITVDSLSLLFYVQPIQYAEKLEVPKVYELASEEIKSKSSNLIQNVTDYTALCLIISVYIYF